jgi:hypothetical protein
LQQSRELKKDLKQYVLRREELWEAPVSMLVASPLRLYFTHHTSIKKLTQIDKELGISTGGLEIDFK